MIGTDFELFMKQGDQHIPVPSTLHIGSKNGQHVQLGLGTMHRDNVMVELCPNPVTSADAMIENVMGLVDQAEVYLSSRMGEPIKLGYDPTVRFGMDDLNHEYAQELGCDVDFLAANGIGTERDAMNADKLGTVRCGGGHVHLSYGVHNECIQPPVAVHLADLTLGTLEATMGSQGARRNYYGLPGLYRPKSYGAVRGVEYRTPSNLWLASRQRIEAMATNALSLEAVIRNEPAKKIIAFLQEHWPVFMELGTLPGENEEDAKMFIGRVAQEFPNHQWSLGV